VIIRTKFNGYAADGTRRYFKGGGGVKYDNLEQLYAIQAEQAKSLMDQANANVYPAYNSLLEEAKNTGSQANQEIAAGRAGADVVAAQGGAKKQLEQQLSSMGVNPNDQKFANTMAAMDLDAAAQKASAMTGARDKTRDLGFAKLTDTVNAGMGIGSNAVAALNSAGGMASNIAGLQQQGQANRDANLGNIAALGTRLLMNKGGLVPKSCSKQVKGYNRGGIIGAMQGVKAAPPPSGATAPSPLSRAASQVATGGTPGAGKAIETVGNLVGKVAPEAGNSISSFGTGLRLGDKAQPAIDAYKAASAGTEAATAATAGAEAGTAAAAGAEAAGTAAAGAEAAGAAAAGAEAAGAAAAGAEAAGATATAMGAGSAIGSALSVAMPWIGGAMLIGSALDLFADGGEVKAHKIGGQQGGDGVAESDTGGKVDGPGGPKEDKVLARLSPGEFVMPVATVKMYGLERLEKMRKLGLRHEKQLGIR